VRERGYRFTPVASLALALFARECVYKERYYRCIYIGNTSNAVQWKRKRESQRESKKEGGWAREGGMGEREIKREEGAK
jgi:hypothetical protein